jgi:hypothetical protein
VVVFLPTRPGRYPVPQAGASCLRHGNINLRAKNRLAIRIAIRFVLREQMRTMGGGAAYRLAEATRAYRNTATAGP